MGADNPLRDMVRLEAARSAWTGTALSGRSASSPEHRKSRIGTFDNGLEEAPKWGRPVIPIKRDCKIVFPLEQK